jgi:lipopolysaccharide transport system permease protein
MSTESVSRVLMAGSPEGRPVPSGGAPPAVAGPVVVVEPVGAWGALHLRETWEHRELLLFLTLRDVKVRYKQTVLGLGWVVLLPLLTAIVFTVFLGNVARVDSGGVPYPLFVYSALLPWTFFASAVTSGAGSVVGSAHLVTKVYFPRVIVPAAAIGARLVDFAISFLVLVGMMLVYQVAPTRSLLMVPVLVVLVSVLSFALGLMLAAVNVRWRDVGMAVPVLLQLWMFASPVVYSASMVPAKWRMLYNLNPVVGIVGNFRVAVAGGAFDWPALAVSAIATVTLLLLSAYVFARVERNFADYI